MLQFSDPFWGIFCPVNTESKILQKFKKVQWMNLPKTKKSHVAAFFLKIPIEDSLRQSHLSQF